MPSEMQPPIPAYYDDLNASLAEAWRLLTRGAADRRSPIHTPAVATVGLDGRPNVRVVVLRHADPIARTLRFHTDRRSAKIGELSTDAGVQIVAYDPGRKIQLRVTGRGAVHLDDDVARDAWMRSQPQSQICYRQAAAPGAAADDPARAALAADHDGAENFAAVSVAIDEIEWLFLASSGHRRARFIWRDGVLSSTWLAP